MPTQLNWSTSPTAASDRGNPKPSLQPYLPTEAAGAQGIRDLFKSPNSLVLACSKQHLYVISCKSSLVAAWNPLKYFVRSNFFKVINHRCFSPVFSGWEYPNLPTSPVWTSSPQFAGCLQLAVLPTGAWTTLHFSSWIMGEVHREAWSPPGFAEKIKGGAVAPVLALQKLCQVRAVIVFLKRKPMRGYRLQGSTPKACVRLGLSRCWLDFRLMKWMSLKENHWDGPGAGASGVQGEAEGFGFF